MIPRTILWISLLIAGSFPALALSQQATVDSETSAPSDHQAHTSVSGDHDGTMGDHDEMMGDHDGAMGDHEGMHHDHGVDHNTPASLKCTHILEPGEWMIGYRYSNTYMGGNQTGTTSLGNQQALNFPSSFTPPGSMYTMVPTSMTMEMHMMDIMRGITDDVTLYLMPMWMDNTMNMLVNDGTTSRMTNGGFSDLPFGALWRLYHDSTDEIILDIGFSAPTGDIHNMTMMPMGMGMSMPMVFPYTMRLGHGTWDACPGITYRHYWDHASFGLQGTFDLPMGMNDEQYQVGNEYHVTAWLAYLLDAKKAIAATFRIEGLWRSNYVGADPQLDPTMTSESDPTMRGGDYLNFGYGLMWRLPGHLGVLEGEFVQPIVQNVRGMQETTEASFAVRYVAMF